MTELIENFLKRFAQVKRISEDRTTEGVYEFDVEGREAGCGPCLRRLDGVMIACEARSQKLRNTKINVRIGRYWRASCRLLIPARVYKG